MRTAVDPILQAQIDELWWLTEWAKSIARVSGQDTRPLTLYQQLLEAVEEGRSGDVLAVLKRIDELKRGWPN